MPRVSAVRGEEKPEAPPEIVVPVMTGTHFHALDDKGRVIIPAKLRPGLTERFWMMLDENDNVAMYNHSTGQDVLEYCERQMAQNPGDEFIAAAVERITGAAELVIIEGEAWRVAVSDILRFRSQIEKEIVSVGVLNKAVMWSRERWEEAQKQRESPEVRRAQAEMLRAAASGLKKSLNPQVETEKVDEDAKRRTGTDRATAASAGDDARDSRVLTLSQLGR